MSYYKKYEEENIRTLLVRISRLWWISLLYISGRNKRLQKNTKKNPKFFYDEEVEPEEKTSQRSFSSRGGGKVASVNELDEYIETNRSKKSRNFSWWRSRASSRKISSILSVHQCPLCKVNMHPFCGTPVGQEDFGQKIICPACSGRDESEIESDKGSIISADDEDWYANDWRIPSQWWGGMASSLMATCCRYIGHVFNCTDVTFNLGNVFIGGHSVEINWNVGEFRPKGFELPVH